MSNKDYRFRLKFYRILAFMKRLILLFLLFSACHIMAQRRFNGVNNLYYRDTTFYENGYTYQCDVQEGSMFITLYNKENKYTYVDQTFKGTNRPVSIKDTERGGPHLEPDNWTKKKTSHKERSFYLQWINHAERF